MTEDARQPSETLLTSHYMGDVTALAKRVLVIDHGALRFDDELQRLVEDHSPFRVITLTLREPSATSSVANFGEVVSVVGVLVSLRVPRATTTRRVGVRRGRCQPLLMAE